MGMIVLQGGTLIDGTGQSSIPNSLVTIEGINITFVGKNGEMNIPKGGRVKVIDAKGKTVMPGLIDSHLHMG
jgi:imidazolonepropionase-like amidohydrolase